MKIFIKPSGVEVPVNENSEAAALAMGWKPKDAADEFVEAVADAVETSEAEAPRQKRKYTRKAV